MTDTVLTAALFVVGAILAVIGYFLRGLHVRVESQLDLIKSDAEILNLVNGKYISKEINQREQDTTDQAVRGLERELAGLRAHYHDRLVGLTTENTLALFGFRDAINRLCERMERNPR